MPHEFGRERHRPSSSRRLASPLSWSSSFCDVALQLVDGDEARPPAHLDRLDERQDPPVQRRATDAERRGGEATALDLLEASTLFALATVTPEGGAYVNTAYFARGPRFELVWLSDPVARHSRNAPRAPVPRSPSMTLSRRGGGPTAGSSSSEGHMRPVTTRRPPPRTFAPLASQTFA